ncbi:uncharacterized protein BP5553_05140 [Venustampulla echinocandica]|uniref:Uncharacterized protein n=1 Tax=Venustampulla echinocandica TaxID=2656787 RepID=A0A370TQ98_9HELO|nr:uncharacterized protein BP5553_05140 [Venustampulla echinocandica]RDL37707.1 hypothetical protein BP5553_05140 [Venustampulla echinocandica]
MSPAPPPVPPGVPPAIPPGIPPVIPPGVPPGIPPGIPPAIPPGIPPGPPPPAPPRALGRRRAQELAGLIATSNRLNAANRNLLTPRDGVVALEVNATQLITPYNYRTHLTPPPVTQGRVLRSGGITYR